MAIKFGVNQVNQNAPLAYKRVESAIVMILIPAVTTFIMSLSIDSNKQKDYIAIAVFVGAIAKAIGVFLGSDETPTSTESNSTDTSITPNKN